MAEAKAVAVAESTTTALASSFHVLFRDMKLECVNPRCLGGWSSGNFLGKDWNTYGPQDPLVV